MGKLLDPDVVLRADFGPGRRPLTAELLTDVAPFGRPLQHGSFVT